MGAGSVREKLLGCFGGSSAISDYLHGIFTNVSTNFIILAFACVDFGRVWFLDL